MSISGNLFNSAGGFVGDNQRELIPLYGIITIHITGSISGRQHKYGGFMRSGIWKLSGNFWDIQKVLEFER